MLISSPYVNPLHYTSAAARFLFLVAILIFNVILMHIANHGNIITIGQYSELYERGG
jgi:hypothetical protein